MPAEESPTFISARDKSNQKSLPIQLRRIKSQDGHPKQSPAVNQPNHGIEVGTQSVEPICKHRNSDFECEKERALVYKLVDFLQKISLVAYC